MSLTVLLLFAAQIEAPADAERLPMPSGNFSESDLVSTAWYDSGDAPKLPPAPGISATTGNPVESAPAPGPLPESYESAPPAMAPCCDGVTYMAGGITPGCPTCPTSDDFENTKLCKLHSTCDMYPHYAYYPAAHGYYYFRPYNYTSVAEHQQFAACIGLDPRMPYSLANFQRLYASFEMKFSPARAPVGTALPQGSGLPQLEDLLSGE